MALKRIAPSQRQKKIEAPTLVLSSTENLTMATPSYLGEWKFKMAFANIGNNKDCRVG